MSSKGSKSIKYMAVPSSAIQYILYQRTDLSELPQNIWFRCLKLLRITPSNNSVIWFESKIRTSAIKNEYGQRMHEEYNSIKAYLPNSANKILDIGCGIGGLDVFLWRHYRSTAQLLLLDKTYTEQEVYYQFNKNAAFYNSLPEATKLLIANGVPEERITALEVANPVESTLLPGELDVVISLLSWGFHYPIDTYLEKVFIALHKNGVLIVDVRAGTNGIDCLNDKFGNARVILNHKKYQRVIATRQ